MPMCKWQNAYGIIHGKVDISIDITLARIWCYLIVFYFKGILCCYSIKADNQVAINLPHAQM